MTVQHRDVTSLPFDQRGHQQIHHVEHLRVEQTGFMKNDAAPETPIEWINPAYIYSGAFNCAACDEYPSYSVEVDAAGEPVKLVAKTSCGLTDGVPMVIEIAVPSGKIIVNDDLRPAFDFHVLGYNSLVGQADAQRQMAAQGCAYGPVGNTSPSLMRTGEGSYILASFDDELEPDEEGYMTGEVLAKVCTDLWAYSIADLDHFVASARAKYEAADEKEREELVRRELFAWAVQPGDPRDRIEQLGWTVTVVDVTPGTYRFTHHTGEPGFDDDARPVVYAHVELV